MFTGLGCDVCLLRRELLADRTASPQKYLPYLLNSSTMFPEDRAATAEAPIAEKSEIRGLYLTSLAHGPTASVLIIFIQLLIIKQTKYLAAENSEGESWIEWREKFSDGDLCNGTGIPFPKHAAEPYARPEGYSDDCVWFPSDKSVPGLGIQYTNTVVYGSTAVLFLTGVLLLIVGPFSDYGHYRKQLLIGCVLFWIPAFSLMFFVSDPDLYSIGLTLTVVGTVAYAFGLRSPFASYLPLLINASHELVEHRRRLQHADCEGSATGAVSIELSQRLDRTPTAEDVGLPTEPSSDTGLRDEAVTLSWKHVTPSITEISEESSGVAELLGERTFLASDDQETHQLREEYQNLYEAVAGKTAIGESACFIGAQLVCLLIQFGLLLWLSDEDNPKDTRGERSALLVSTAWGGIFCYLGISRLKNREGPPFPIGNKFMIGVRRSGKTFKLLYQRMPALLCLMIGRMLFWLAIQTVLAMSTLFFEREFAMTAKHLAPIVLLYLAVGVPSAIATSVIIQRHSGNILRIFKVYCLLVMSIPLYMLLGVRERFEIYLLMCLSAVLVAPFPAMVRAMMADMIPQGFTATIMSFEGLLENCTTWIGPLLVGGLLDLTDSLRFSLFALEIFMVAGLPFVFYSNLQKGREQKVTLERWMLHHSFSRSYKSQAP